MSVVPLPLPWAAELMFAVDGHLPVYGSPEWADLPDTSRAKVAACVVAAEAWRTRHHRASVGLVTSRRAREIADARRPRPGDHPGGPVPWERDRERVPRG